jgi:membrane protease YdiL (CAAX protease family)
VFRPEFDRPAIALSLSAIIILFYFGLSEPSLYMDLWVAFGFWMVGFFGSYLLFTAKSKAFTFQRLLEMGLMTGTSIGIMAVINYSYAILVQASTTLVTLKLMNFAIGISEELFFGVFLLTALMRIGFHPALAILGTSIIHSIYHIPNWGANMGLLLLFTISFIIIRTVFVYFYPKVGFLLGVHGFWNLGVS